MQISNNKINFGSVLTKIRKCKMLDENMMKLFFEECYADLINRMEVEDDNNESLKVIFNKFLDLPVIASDKIFSLLNESNSGKLSKKEFSVAMYNLYCSDSLECLKQITFKLFCFNSKDVIMKEDVMILLTYISSSEKIFNILDSAIQEFFRDSIAMEYVEYSSIIENRNSNIFLILLIYLYENKPFNEDALEFFYQNNKKRALNLNNNIFKQEVCNNLISDPNNEIKNLFKYIFNFHEGKVSRKAASKSLNKIHEKVKVEKDEKDEKEEMSNRIIFYDNIEDNNDEEKYIENYCFLNLASFKIEDNLPNSSKITNESSNPSLVKISSSCFSKAESNTSSNKSSNSNSLSLSFDYSDNLPGFSDKNLNKLSNFSKYVSHSTNIFSNEILYHKDHELIAYKYRKEGKIVKFKLVAINNILFSLIYSNSKNEFRFYKIHPMNGYFFAKCEKMKIDDQIFFPLALLNKLGSSIANMKNIFFCKSEIERNEFVDLLNNLMKINVFKEDYKFLSELGEGQFGKVKLAYCKKTNKKVAVKIINKTKLKSEEYNIVATEMDVMKFLMNFDHPNVVIPIDILEDNQFIYLVLEYMQGGTLNNYLVSQGRLLQEKEIKNIASQMLEGLLFLGSVGIMHRDLKPENILLSLVNGRVANLKIADFGLSKVLAKYQTTFESYGTLYYTAPEILLNKKYGSKIDCWSFGVILFYMMTGSVPFESNNNNNSEKISIKICNEPINFPNSLNKQFKSLIGFCLNKNPVERFSFEQIKSSEWMNV